MPTKKNGKRNRYWKARAEERKYLIAQSKIKALLGNEDDESLAAFCTSNGIRRSGDSFYFRIGGVKYRVSNHSEQYSNLCARNYNGKKTRRLYHRKDDNIRTILAPKEKLEEIYLRLQNES